MNLEQATIVARLIRQGDQLAARIRELRNEARNKRNSADVDDRLADSIEKKRAEVLRKLVEAQNGTLIYPPTVWSSNWPEGDKRHGKVTRPVPYECYTRARASLKVGDRIVHYAAAPGVGCVKYHITRIDETGVYGVEVENTIRQLDPSEVE